MLTIDEINAMSPAELEALNKKLAKRLVTRIAVRIAIGVAFAIAASALVNKLNSTTDDDI